MSMCIIELLLIFLGLRFDTLPEATRPYLAAWLSITKSNAYVAETVFGDNSLYFSSRKYDYSTVSGTPFIYVYDNTGQYVTTVINFPKKRDRAIVANWNVHSMQIRSTTTTQLDVATYSYRLRIADDYIHYYFESFAIAFLCRQYHVLGVTIVDRYYPMEIDDNTFRQSRRHLLDTRYILPMGRIAFAVAVTSDLVELSILTRQ